MFLYPVNINKVSALIRASRCIIQKQIPKLERNSIYPAYVFLKILLYKPKGEIISRKKRVIIIETIIAKVTFTNVNK